MGVIPLAISMFGVWESWTQRQHDWHNIDVDTLFVTVAIICSTATKQWAKYELDKRLSPLDCFSGQLAF